MTTTVTHQNVHNLPNKWFHLIVMIYAELQVLSKKQA
jgi:hypothetical protein